MSRYVCWRIESNVERSVAALLYVAVIMDIVIASLMVSVRMRVDREGEHGLSPLAMVGGGKENRGGSQRRLNMAMSLSFSAAERMARRTIC